MTSPRDAGFPSLPELDKSMADKVKESVKTGVLGIADLIRGPVGEPHAELDGAPDAGTAEASVGKATSDSVSNGRVCGALGFAGVCCESDGKGSGAPSSSCLFYIS